MARLSVFTHDPARAQRPFVQGASVGAVHAPRRFRQSGHQPGRAVDTASTTRASEESLTRSTRTSIPGNSTSSTVLLATAGNTRRNDPAFPPLTWGFTELRTEPFSRIPITAGETGVTQCRGASAEPPGSAGGDRPGLVPPRLGHRLATRLPPHPRHIKADGTLPTAAGQIIAQGEDLGAWAAAQRLGWNKLLPAQQWLLESALALDGCCPDSVEDSGRWGCGLRRRWASRGDAGPCGEGGGDGNQSRTGVHQDGCGCGRGQAVGRLADHRGRAPCSYQERARRQAPAIQIPRPTCRRCPGRLRRRRVAWRHVRALRRARWLQ